MRNYHESLEPQIVPLLNFSARHPNRPAIYSTAHSAVEYAYLYGRPADGHPSIVHLTIRDRQQLEKLRADLESKGIVTSHFSEPYMDWGVTAISCMLTEDQRHLLTHLQLWTSSPKTI